MKSLQSGITQTARDLRRNETEAERRLWVYLRGARLDGYKFRRQEPLGPFVADFVCLARMLVVELDGKPHETAEGLARDAERTAWLTAKGYRVLRFTNDTVREELPAVLTAIREALEQER